MTAPKIKRKIPVRVNRKTKTIRLTIETIRELNRRFPPPTPLGDTSDLRKALKILALDDDDERNRYSTEITEAAVAFLAFNKDTSRTMGDEIKVLRRVTRTAELLEALVWNLHLNTKLSLTRVGWPDQSSHLRDTADYLRDLAVAVKTAISDLDKRYPRGRAKTMKANTYGSPHARFMKKTISLYSKAGHEVTNYVPSAEGRGESCYSFTYFAFLFATGEAIGRGKDFKALVKEWHRSRTAIRGALPKNHQGG